ESEAGRQPQDGSGVLWNIRLKQGDMHAVHSLRSAAMGSLGRPRAQGGKLIRLGDAAPAQRACAPPARVPIKRADSDGADLPFRPLLWSCPSGVPPVSALLEVNRPAR